MNRIFLHTVMKLAMLLATLLAPALHAENFPVGQWNHFPAYATPTQKVVDTGSMVYYASGGALFAYDVKNDETRTYSSENYLNGYTITDIFYSAEQKLLLVAYEDGNIDLLYDDGKIVNLSDIRDSSIAPPLTINDVAFTADRIYVATEFGIVEYNPAKAEVVQSGIYNKRVSAVAINQGKLFINTDGKVLAIDLGSRISSLSNFIEVCPLVLEAKKMWPEEDGFLVQGPSALQILFTLPVDFQTMKGSALERIAPQRTLVSSYITESRDGQTLYYVADGVLYGVDRRERKEQKLAELPEELANAKIASPEGLSSVWSITSKGLAHHSLGTDGSLTVLSERFRPEDFSVRRVCYFYPTPDNSYLFVRNEGTTYIKFNINDAIEMLGRSKLQTSSRIELATGEKQDVTLYPVDTRYNANSLDKFANAISGMTPDPDDPEVYYLASSVDGVFKVRNGKYEGRYNDLNSPFVKFDNRYIAWGTFIDRGGNLWVIRHHNDYACEPIMILPADKRKLNPDEVKASDWFVPEVLAQGYEGGQEVSAIDVNGMVFIGDMMKATAKMLVYDTRRTYDDFSDDRFYGHSSFVDQDGVEYNDFRITSIRQDRRGRLWITTGETGIFEISNPSSALNSSMRVTHLKVPRTDGSGLADYLLGTELIQDLSVDASNRKWVATAQSGLYLVSPDGDEVLRRYTTDNSPLPDNMVNCVYADPSGSTIYVGTMNGLYTLSTDAAPAAEDYSDIYAYPNPVRPDYFGDIYVRGLKENSLVKISDSQGAVVYQGRAEGGLFVWDGRNSAGNRMPTGVYYVFASAGSADESGGAVTKILIVN